MRHFKIKNIFSYVVVAALVAALSISCKSNEEPPKDNTHSNHPPSGTYKGTVGSVTPTATVTTSGGACKIKGIAYNPNDVSDYKEYDITITKWYGESSSISGYVLLENGQNYTGQATINSPKGTTRFFVEKDNANAISIQFDTYRVYGLKRQE